MGQRRCESYDSTGTCTRVWYEEVPDPPLAEVDTAVEPLNPVEVLALKTTLSAAVSLASVKTVLSTLIDRLST